MQKAVAKQQAIGLYTGDCKVCCDIQNLQFVSDIVDLLDEGEVDTFYDIIEEEIAKWAESEAKAVEEELGDSVLEMTDQLSEFIALDDFLDFMKQVDAEAWKPLNNSSAVQDTIRKSSVRLTQLTLSQYKDLLFNVLVAQERCINEKRSIREGDIEPISVEGAPFPHTPSAGRALYYNVAFPSRNNTKRVICKKCSAHTTEFQHMCLEHVHAELRTLRETIISNTVQIAEFVTRGKSRR